MIILKKLVILCFIVSFCFIFSISYNGVFDNISSENKLTTKNPTIIIDAGHGGFDGGTSTDDGVSEKGINLDIALYLKEYLNLFGFNVVMTRETDTSTESEGLTTIRSKKSSDLHNRMSLMEKTDNAIFVSIHQNHFHHQNIKVHRCFIHRSSVNKVHYLQKVFRKVSFIIYKKIIQGKLNLVVHLFI